MTHDILNVQHHRLTLICQILSLEHSDIHRITDRKYSHRNRRGHNRFKQRKTAVSLYHLSLPFVTSVEKRILRWRVPSSQEYVTKTSLRPGSLIFTLTMHFPLEIP